MSLHFNDKKDYDAFKEVLLDLSKTQSVSKVSAHKKMLNSPREVLAIKMSEIRKVASSIPSAELKSFLSLVQNNTYEEVLVWGLAICRLDSVDEQIKYFDEWKEVIDSWSLVDTVSASMKVLNNFEGKQKYFDYFYKLCYSKKEFVSRFGIVTIMQNYLCKQNIDKIFKMCREVKNDGYYVKMALAWLISEAYIQRVGDAEKLLAEKTLDKFTQNKAISKCIDSFRITDEEKQNLKKYKV